MGRTVYKRAKRFINWPDGVQSGRTVYKLAERLIPRMNGRSCNYFGTCGSLPSAWGSLSFNNHWQSSLTRDPHRLYYVCRLRETFRRDTAEMAPCWLYLVASAIDCDCWPPSSTLVTKLVLL